MNEKFHNSIKKAGEHISLTPSEHERMRGVLHAYMEMKPVRSSQSIATISTQHWFFSLRPVAAVLVLMLFVSSAGVSYAAENALPGDALYTVKTSINEPVRGALAVSASAKVAWATSVAGERMKEAATLAAEGRLSSTTQQELQTSFETHAQEATRAIQMQASSTPDEGAEAAVRFEAQLSEYGALLAQVGVAKQIDVTALVSSVQTQGERIGMVRARAESHLAVASPGDFGSTHMQAAAKQQFDDSSELAHAGISSLSSSSADLVAVQLESASTSISAGESFAAENATSDAIGAFKSALATTEKLGVFLRASTAIHARTGLVVAQPASDSVRPEAKRVNASGEQSPITARAPGIMSATLFSAPAPEAATSSTTTDMHENSEVKIGAGNDMHAEGKEEGGDRGEQTLPLSVPIHISF